MKLNKLGRTNICISEIGLGCEGFAKLDEAETLRLMNIAIEKGVNCIDLYSPDPDLQRRLGKAIRPVREQFVIQGHLCTVWKEGQYEATRDIDEVKASFYAMLDNLGTNYIDIGMIHYVDSVKTWQEIEGGEIMHFALELKQKGVIKSIGLSSHNPKAALAAVNSGLVDVLMFSVNPCYDLLPGDEDCEKLWTEESYSQPLFDFDPERKALYELCEKLGVGITSMKTFGGGDLLSDYSPAKKALTPLNCIHYALTRPAVASALLGIKNEEELTNALYYEQASDAEKDYAPALAAFPKISWKGHCMYCGHCAPCSAGIDIAMVTKLLSLTKDALPETVREHYAALEKHASDCVECGNCMGRCPFEVDIIGNMQAANKVFGY